MAHFAVSAIGRDRPGIVAGLSKALLELEGNIEDSRMAILRGRFAVMLIVSVPERHERSEVEERLAAIAEPLGLESVTATPVEELEPRSSEASHVITVYGADHPGIVHAVTSALAARDVNVTDLQTKLGGGAGAPLYVMVLEVSLGDAAAPEVERALDEVAGAAEVEVTLRPIDSTAL